MTIARRYKLVGFSRHTEKHSTAANVTQNKYGSNSAPAKARCRQNSTTVQRISTHKTIISANDAAPKCQAKNDQLQSALAASCTIKSANARRAPENPSRFQTSHAATAISAYRIVQTGPNTFAGGAHVGLVSAK